MKAQRNPRIRLHLSEQTSAELHSAFRQSGCHSWDDFFANLLQQPATPGAPPIKTIIRQEAQPIRHGVEQMQGTIGQLQLLMAGMSEDLHTLHLEMEETRGYVTRVSGLLEMAFELAGGKPPEPKPAEGGLSPEEEEVLRKIHNRNLE